jgi:hypothetical protein
VVEGLVGARGFPLVMFPSAAVAVSDGNLRLLLEQRRRSVESEHRRKLRAFVEVDRSTMSSERLAVKLIEYARLFQYEARPVGPPQHLPGYGELQPAPPRDHD